MKGKVKGRTVKGITMRGRTVRGITVKGKNERHCEPYSERQRNDVLIEFGKNAVYLSIG